MISFNLQLECSDVVLFWRLHRMLGVTSNALRNQVVNNEGMHHFDFKYGCQDFDKAWLPIYTMLKFVYMLYLQKPYISLKL